MPLIPSRSSGLSATFRRRYWRTALAGAVMLASALFAVTPASAAVMAKPARAAIVSTVQIGGRSHATQPSGPVSEGRIISTLRTGIEEQPCSGRGTWVHFYGASTRCFGFKGTIITNFTADEICAGNNSGYFIYTAYGHRNTQKFSPGFYWAFPQTFTINAVSISGWSGNYSCGG